MKEILYFERQHARWAYVSTVVTVALLSLLYFFEWGTNPMPLAGYLVLTGIMIGVFCLFCKMETIVDDEFVRIRYGLFGFSKMIAVSELKSVKKVRYPVYYGVGIRMVPNGTLYCVNFSDAVEITLIDSPYTYSIGTAEAEKLIAVLEDLSAHNDKRNRL